MDRYKYIISNKIEIYIGGSDIIAVIATGILGKYENIGNAKRNNYKIQ